MSFFESEHIASDYRAEAKRICDLKVDKLAIIYLVYAIILFVVGVIDSLTGFKNVIEDIEVKTTWFNGLFSLICGGPFAISLAYITKNVHNSIEPKITNLFEGFKDFSRAFLLSLLQAIYIALWTLLLIVPGIIKALSYSMSYFVAIDNKDLTASECIEESQRIMNGHKWQYFCLIMSYLGWLILSVLTLGILFLWVAPRIMEASYLFYLDITGKGSELENKTEIIEETTEEVVE